MKSNSFFTNIKDLKRVEEIVSVFAKNGFAKYFLQLKLDGSFLKDSKQKDLEHERISESLKKSFEELGGAFVKLGQILSLRQDLLPPQYTQSFSELQNKVKPFSGTIARNIIEKELGRPVKDIFLEFDEKPLAAASIAQVHLAKLKNGRHVAVKIKRPNIEEIFEKDIAIIKYIARKIEDRYDLGIIKPSEIISEFERYTKRELSFNQEKMNLIRFKTLHLTHVKTPTLYSEYCTDSILVMEYLDGISINEVEKIKKHYDKHAIARALVTSVFEQIFEHGVFHGDPHPGNVLVLSNNKIGLVDFGIVGYLTKSTRNTLFQLFIALVEGNVDLVADSIMDLGVVKYDFDKEVLKEDLFTYLGDYYNVPLDKINVSLLFEKIIEFSRKDKMTLPLSLILLSKTIVTLEGYGRQLYPDFNIVKEAKPYLKQQVNKEFSYSSVKNQLIDHGLRIKRLLTLAPEQLFTFFTKLNKGELKLTLEHKDVEELSDKIEHSATKTTYAILLAAFIIAGALMSQVGTPVVGALPFGSIVMFGVAGFFFLLFIKELLR